MLDSGAHHEVNDLFDKADVKSLAEWTEESGISFLAKRLLDRWDSNEIRAKLFDALLEKDKKVYGIRRRFDHVLNPYSLH